MDSKQLEEVWGDLQEVFERKASFGMDRSVRRTKHAKEQMNDRNITWDDVIKVSRNMPEEFYLPHMYPPDYDNEDHVFSITGRDTKGRKINVAIAAIHSTNRFGKPVVDFRVVTVMLVLKNSRHNKTIC